MSRHWVKQSDDHKGKVDRFCFQSKLAFIVSLGYFGINIWYTGHKYTKLELRFGYKRFRGGSGQTWYDSTDSFLAYHLAECVHMEHDISQYVLKHSNKARGEGGTEPIILLQYILGKERQIYIYSVHAISVKLVICFYLKSKRCSQIY